MFYKIIVMFLICHNIEAQDEDCDYYQEVIPPKTYWIQPPEYPNIYRKGRTCRWIGECLIGYNNCRVDCELQMPQSPNCSADHILISRTGDETLTGAERYCGLRNVTSVSFERTIVIGLIVPQNSRGGRFRCRLRSKPSTTNPKDCRCGDVRQTRIVGGNATGVHQYNMMAGIRDINTYEVFCGASIIKFNWVISAAHCLYEEGQLRYPRDLRIIVGNRDTQRTVQYQVRQYFTHPAYVPNGNYDYDVSLLQTITEIQFSNSVRPVCLPYALANDNFVGNNVTVLGWGTLGPGKPTTNILQAVDLRVVSSNFCQQNYPEIDITSRRLCTFARGKDSCQMDSGGPLLVEKEGSWFLAGLVSFGVDCAPAIPSVNTRVTPYLNWITTTIGPKGICVRSLDES